MKLSEPAGLRPLVTKHGPDVEVFLRQRISASIVFDEGADGARSPFRS